MIKDILMDMDMDMDSVLVYSGLFICSSEILMFEELRLSTSPEVF